MGTLDRLSSRLLTRTRRLLCDNCKGLSQTSLFLKHNFNIEEKVSDMGNNCVPQLKFHCSSECTVIRLQ